MAWVVNMTAETQETPYDRTKRELEGLEVAASDTVEEHPARVNIVLSVLQILPHVNPEKRN